MKIVCCYLTSTHWPAWFTSIHFVIIIPLLLSMQIYLLTAIMYNAHLLWELKIVMEFFFSSFQCRKGTQQINSANRIYMFFSIFILFTTIRRSALNLFRSIAYSIWLFPFGFSFCEDFRAIRLNGCIIAFTFVFRTHIRDVA